MPDFAYEQVKQTASAAVDEAVKKHVGYPRGEYDHIAMWCAWCRQQFASIRAYGEHLEAAVTTRGESK